MQSWRHWFWLYGIYNSRPPKRNWWRVGTYIKVIIVWLDIEFSQQLKAGISGWESFTSIIILELCTEQGSLAHTWTMYICRGALISCWQSGHRFQTSLQIWAPWLSAKGPTDYRGNDTCTAARYMHVFMQPFTVIWLQLGLLRGHHLSWLLT